MTVQAVPRRNSDLDGRLIAGCLAGDESCWEKLINEYAGLIHGVALRYGLSEHDAADVFQNVCLELWRSLPKIKEPEKLPGWLVTVTGRAACQALRKRIGRPERHGDDEELDMVADADLP